MEYIWIVCTTALIRTSFPDCERDFFFQCFIFWFTLSTIPANIYLSHLPIKVGNPRYFEWLSTAMTPRHLLSSFCFSIVMFELHVISVFSKFIRCPEACSYLWITSFTVSASSIVALVNRIESSAKKNVRPMVFLLPRLLHVLCLGLLLFVVAS